MLSQYKCRADTYLERKEKYACSCLNADALQMPLLLLFCIDGLTSHYGGKEKHLVYITRTCVRGSFAGIWAGDVCMLRKAVSDPYWRFFDLCFLSLFPVAFP